MITRWITRCIDRKLDDAWSAPFMARAAIAELARDRLMAVRRVFPPELLPSLVDELDDMRVDECLGDLVLARAVRVGVADTERAGLMTWRRHAAADPAGPRRARRSRRARQRPLRRRLVAAAALTARLHPLG
jgi:hypothetical protein